jgi:P-type Ca2+ transporter type 2C
MDRPPRPSSEGIFAHGMVWHVVLVGFLMAAITLTFQKMNLHLEESRWRTLAFTALCFSQLAHVLVIRSDKESLFRIGFFSNRPLFFAVAVTFILQLGTIYVPWMNDVFHTSPLSAMELLSTVAISFLVILAVELEKWARRKMRKP